MKTLVIHPKDNTTDFLSDIYSDKDWTIVNKLIGKHILKQLIKSHDRIVMLGHGTEKGLINSNKTNYIIDSTWVQMLREKQCVCIWCNANIFFEKYKLKGFYTGMIVSEIDEAYQYSLSTNFDMIQESNTLFAKSIKESIDKDNMLQLVKDKYNINNSIINFNRYNLYDNR